MGIAMGNVSVYNLKKNFSVKALEKVDDEEEEDENNE